MRECVRVPHTEGEMCGDLCDLLTDVCLGLGVWPHMQRWVRLTYLISLLCSLFLSLSLILFITHTHSHTLCLHTRFTHICSHTHPFIHTPTHTHTQPLTHTPAHSHTHSHTHIRSHTHSHTHTHPLTLTHTHIHYFPEVI